MTTEMEPIDKITSWHAIYDLSCNYMRAQDRLIPELHRSVFHDDATTDYGAGYSGDADGFVAFAQEVLSAHLGNQHMIGQVHIDFEEKDVAFGEVYFQAFHRIMEETGEQDLWVSGRYIDRYERRDGVWKIAHRSELVDWIRQEPAAEGPLGANPGMFILGSRAPNDFSCRREEVRIK